MRTKDQQTPTPRTYPRREVLGAGLGAASLTAGGLLGSRSVGAAWQEATPGALPADAAEEQVLRVQANSSGATEFVFQPLAGGGGMVFWVSLWYLPPMYFDLDYNLKPLIFDSWQGNEDSTVWTFTIDPRAHWSDGTPITAAQVKGTWELMADPVVENSRIREYMGDVVGFEQVLNLEATEATGLVVQDERTLEVQLNTSDPIFHWRVATVNLCPVKVEDAREDPVAFWRPENNPVCSGPYRLDSWDPDGGTATMVQNPDWWLGEGQYLDRIEFRDVADLATILLMIRNGEVDVVHPDWTLPPELEEDYPGLFRPTVSFGYDMFWLRTASEPTNDINVRKALILAVNQEDVFRAAYPLGRATLNDQLLDSDLPCRETEQTWYPYDPEAAKAALAESSYGSAENLPTIRVTPRGADPENGRALEAVLEFWRQNLGIQNVVFELEPQGFGPDEPNINLTRDDVVTRLPDSASYMYVAAHSASPIAVEAMGGYENPEINAIIEEALLTAPDDPARCELALEAQRLFMDDYHALYYGEESTSLNIREYVKNTWRGPDRSFIEPWQIYVGTGSE